MIENTPSRTAQGAAMHRAFHQLQEHPPVFADPLALRIIGADAADTLRAGHDWHTDPRAAARRAFMAARSRFAEDCFAEAHARGVRQYVVMGAGLDTFAYRAPYADIRVFEIDHPATQGWKRERLAEAGIAVASSTVYAPVDFERETIVEGLTRAGFDFSEPAFFAWLGVTMYLTEGSILQTLDLVATRTVRGCEIVFDFSTPRSGNEQSRFAERVARLGEPLKSAFEPQVLDAKVRALGFADVRVVDYRALNARYFVGRSDGFALAGGHMLHATV
jgi:methyltransferase (TIGR00027 family)